MMAAATAALLFKASEDRLSETSESTASGSGSPPSEPPMSPDISKLSRALMKPQERTLSSSSTRTSSTSATMSPLGLTFETESLPSPLSRESFGTLDGELLGPQGPPALSPSDLDHALALEQATDLRTPKAPPPAPKYSAPAVVAPSLPPPPSLPPGVPEPPSAPPRLPPAQHLPDWGVASPPREVASASHGPPVEHEPTKGNSTSAPVPPPGYGASLPDASQRGQLSRLALPISEVLPPPDPPLLPPQTEAMGLLPSIALQSPAAAYGQMVPPLPGAGGTQLGRTDDIEGEVNQGLALLNFLWTGPSVPPLPPSACYGGVLVSSAISEGLGTAAAEAAEAAARELGERPVKVLLPWYPAVPGLGSFDQTKPAKVPQPVPQDQDLLQLS